MKIWVQRLLSTGMALVVATCGAGLLAGAVPRASASFICPNEVFRNGPSSHLPDCRAYEVVSPPAKNGGGVNGGIEAFSAPAPQQSSADGNAVTYASTVAFTETHPLSSLVANQYLSRHGAEGWSTEAINPPQNYPGGEIDKNELSINFSLYQGFSEDLSQGFLVSEEPPLVAGAPLDYYNPYLRENAGGSFVLLSAVKPPTATPGLVDNEHQHGFRVTVGGISRDSSHVIFTANDAITPGAIPGVENLYEWADGHLELISVLPNGEATAGATFGAYSNETLTTYSELEKAYMHAISTDGSRVFWTGPERTIYLHEVGPNGRRRVQVSTGSSPAAYLTASADGSLVYYSEAGDLYQYNVNAGLTTDIAPGAGIVGVLGSSDDGSYVYFIGASSLASGSIAGKNNLYVWHGDNTGSGTITFIAALNKQNYEVQDWALALPQRTSRVTPNGQYAAFEAVEPLTGYDNLPVDPLACRNPGYSGGGIDGELTRNKGVYGEEGGEKEARCVEVYEYSAGLNRLSCVSCDPGGIPPIGNSVLPGGINVLSEYKGWESNIEQQRYLSEDGRLFFNSEDALLPQDTNGKASDVYEYEPNGTGSCGGIQGCVFLISTGASSRQSKFLDAGANGDDVFFVTYEPLVSQDGDQSLDLYDARVDGGFTLPSQPPCSGEACKPPIPPAPSIYGAPASAAFFGVGNSTVQSPVTSAASKKVKKAKKKKSKRRPKGKRNGKARRSDRANVKRKGGR